MKKKNLKTVSSVMKYLFFSIAIILSSSLNSNAQQKPETLHELNQLLINTVMDDLFTPPVAARIYTYPNIAFYECIIHSDTSFKTLTGKLTGLHSLPMPSPSNKMDYYVAGCYAFSFVAQALVGTEEKFSNWRVDFSHRIVKNIDNDVIRYSIRYGKLMADSIIAWAKRDNYIESKGMMRTVLSEEPGTWKPTPSDYAAALEPNWNTLRPMILKTCSQFSPAKKLVYNTAPESEFQKNVKELYSMSKTLDSLKTSIALYWDDNPNISNQQGHLTYYVHKISPGGHWLMITRQACIQNNVKLVKASQAYTLTSIAIFDAFIACWDEKYKTNLIRPVTEINQTFDANWAPLIQTPPFPEFPSGHAMISSAAATILKTLFGEKYSFTDSTEIPFGIKPRSYTSFYQASD
jgi:hypothetical protein